MKGERGENLPPLETGPVLAPAAAIRLTLP